MGVQRAGRRTTLRIRQQRWRMLRRHWRLYLRAAGVFVIAATASMMWMPLLMRAFFAGLYCATFLGLIAYSWTLDGSQWQAMGAEAERWTSKELRKLKGWSSVDAVEFADGDIDHLVVGPAGVLAVETKWTSKPVRIRGRGLSGMWRDPVAQARHSARRARLLIASKGLSVEVIPVLVLWGPRVEPLPGGYGRLGDVRVVVGKQATEWRTRLDAMPVTTTSAEEVLEGIRDYVRTFDDATLTTSRARVLRRLRIG